MKEIRAYVHEVHVPDILHALEQAGLPGQDGFLSVIQVKSSLAAVAPQEREYSLTLGESVTDALRLTLYLPDERVEAALDLIESVVGDRHPCAGWLFVHPVEAYRALREARP